MSIENYQKFEELIKKKTEEITERFQQKSDALKDDFTQKAKENETIANDYYNSLLTIIELNNSEFDKQNKIFDQQINEYEALLLNHQKDLRETTDKKNHLLKQQIKAEENSYNRLVDSYLRIYEHSLTRLQRQRREIEAKKKLSIQNAIMHNTSDIESKQHLIEMALNHYNMELGNNKNSLLNTATQTNDIVKKIKKDYINKDDVLKTETDLYIVKLNERMKEIQAKISDKQRPFLNQFKNDFEQCDREMLEIRNNYTTDLKKLENEYRLKINILHNKINECETRIKQKTNTSDDYINLKQFKKELSKTKREVLQKQINMDKKFNTQIDDLHLKQKDAEITKNLMVNKIKADADFDIAIIQEEIKFQNQMHDLNLKMLKVEEMLEINDIELVLECSEIEKKKNDFIATSNETAFHNDYEAKIQLLKLKNNNIKEKESILKGIDLYKIDQDIKRNEAIMNLSIEHADIKREYNNNKLLNSVKINELINEKNNEICRIRNAILINKIETKRKIHSESLILKNNETTNKKRLTEIENQYQLALKRLEYASLQKKLRFSYNIEIAAMEHEYFISSITSLNEQLKLISNDLADTLLPNFQTFGIEKIKKMLVRSSKERFQMIKAYFKIIENVINKKIDEIATYKFQTLFNDNEEARNDFTNKANEQIELDRTEIVRIKKEIGDNESQIVYIEIDNSTAKGRINFLNKQIKLTKKDTEFKNDRLINRYETEIQELKNNIASANKEISSYRQLISKGNVRIKFLNKSIIFQEKSIKNKEKEYQKKLQALSKKKINVAKIYYAIIDDIESINKQFHTHFQTSDSKIVHYFSSTTTPKKNEIFHIITDEINQTSKLINKMIKNLNSLYRNIIIEQNDLLHKNKIRVKGLKKRAHFTKIRRNTSEKIRYEKIIKTSRIEKDKALKDKKRFIDKSLRLLEELEISTNEKIITTVKELKKYDIQYQSQYKALKYNVISLRKFLKEKQAEFKEHELKRIDMLDEELVLNINNIENNLNKYALINEKEIDVYNYDYNLSINSVNNTNKLEIDALLKEKKIIEDSIAILKKNYNSTIEEIKLEKVQFHDDLRGTKQITTNISRTPKFIKKALIVIKAHRKWRKI